MEVGPGAVHKQFGLYPGRLEGGGRRWAFSDNIESAVVELEGFVLASAALGWGRPTDRAEHPEETRIIRSCRHGFFEERARVLNHLLHAGGVFHVQVHEVTVAGALRDLGVDEGGILREGLVEVGDRTA